MITGSNRQQRSGGSYMHGVLRDAARPFAYRGSAQRMLHGRQGSSRMRPVYGNGFMPVDFKHLLRPYGYEYGAAGPSLPAAAAAGPGAFMQPMTPINAAMASAPATAPAVERAKPVLAQHVQPAIHTPAHKPAGTDKAQVPPVLDIRIPNGDIQKPLAVRVPAQMERSALSAADSPATWQTQTLQAPSKAGVKADAAAASPRRMPADLSLTALARMLEQHNFEKPKAAPEAWLTPEAEKNSVTAVTGLDKAQAEENRRMPGILHKDASSKPAAPAITAAARPSTAKISARPVNLKLPAPRRAPALDKQANSVTQRQPEPQSQARAETSPAPQPARAPRHKPVKSSRRIAVIRQSAPAAFWDRSYLSRPELRMYR